MSTEHLYRNLYEVLDPWVIVRLSKEVKEGIGIPICAECVWAEQNHDMNDLMAVTLRITSHFYASTPHFHADTDL